MNNSLHPKIVDVEKTLFIWILWTLVIQTHAQTQVGEFPEFKTLYKSSFAEDEMEQFRLHERRVNGRLGPGNPRANFPHRHKGLPTVSHNTPPTTCLTPWYTYHFNLLDKLPSRVGELVLQQKRVDTFVQIARDRLVRRHLYHAGNGGKWPKTHQHTRLRIVKTTNGMIACQ